MTIAFRLSPRAQRDLRQMAPVDQRRILAGLQRLAETGHGDITALHGEWEGSAGRRHKPPAAFRRPVLYRRRAPAAVSRPAPGRKNGYHEGQAIDR